jgi:hypothetical protein
MGVEIVKNGIFMTKGDLVLSSRVIYTRGKVKRKPINVIQEVCSAHSTPMFQSEEGAKLSKLNPHYVAGFIDGEGCFAISIGQHKTLKNRREIKLEFEIELRADDRQILERIRETLGCGNIYELNYERYGWHPHVKYKIQKLQDFQEKLIPFFRKYPLQAKKAKSFRIFCQAVEAVAKKEHLTPRGIQKFRKYQQRMRIDGKKTVTARVRENRLPRGVSAVNGNINRLKKPPVKPAESAGPEFRECGTRPSR